MTIKIICDKCKKEIGKNKQGLQQDFLIEFYNTYEKVNVCESCYNIIYKFARNSVEVICACGRQLDLELSLSLSPEEKEKSGEGFIPLGERLENIETKLRQTTDILDRMMQSDLIRKETCKSLRKELDTLSDKIEKVKG
jgi:hypothetical protein